MICDRIPVDVAQHRVTEIGIVGVVEDLRCLDLSYYSVHRRDIGTDTTERTSQVDFCVYGGFRIASDRLVE